MAKTRTFHVEIKDTDANKRETFCSELAGALEVHRVRMRSGRYTVTVQAEDFRAPPKRGRK
jgi:hypothetical protein